MKYSLNYIWSPRFLKKRGYKDVLKHSLYLKVMVEVSSDRLVDTPNSSKVEYNHTDLNAIKNNIIKLDKTEQLEILKIIKNNNDHLLHLNNL